MCLKFVSASLCLGHRGVSCYFLILGSLSCRRQETCIVCVRLTFKEIVSLTIRLLMLKVIHSNRTEVLLIMFTKNAREEKLIFLIF